ncbi:DNA-binding IclR family transcriptional regulator [Paraburkholderia sp. RAU6.4a]|uniref:IclR family transcriptional regulator n=1 Tax=Paraburkholderia sp. RAU6.4a TaxID=2991067 RepID=UPI003D1EEE8F
MTTIVAKRARGNLRYQPLVSFRPDHPLTKRDKLMPNDEPELAENGKHKRDPQPHRTVDRVTSILEEVVYNPGMTFAELVRALDAAKSSVYGFIQGLLAKGWLFEDQNRFYLGPAVYGLTLASGQIRAGLVTHADLETLHKATGLAVFLGVQAGDHLIYISEAGADAVEGFEARSNIRRKLLHTAGGKILVAAKTDLARNAFLRRQSSDEREVVEEFLAELVQIKTSRIATNLRRGGSRYAIATLVHSSLGEPVASVTLVGPTDKVKPRADRLGKLLIKSVDSWAERPMSPREAV